MLKINKDYKCPSEDPSEKQLEQEWIDWGNLLVDDGQSNNVTLHIDDDGNIVYNDGIKIPTISSMKSMIENYYNDILQNNDTCCLNF